jgi:hypothetical protein
MADINYAEVLEKAKAELAVLKTQGFEIAAKIARLERTVMALTSLVEQPALDPAKGITDGIKTALRLVAPAGMFPTTLRLKLEQHGFDFSQQSSPLATIHAVLKRLSAKGYIASFKTEGRIAYRWVSDTPHMRKPSQSPRAVPSETADTPATLPQEGSARNSKGG